MQAWGEKKCKYKTVNLYAWIVLSADWKSKQKGRAIQELAFVGIITDGLAAAPSSTGYVDNGINLITVVELLLYNG